VIPLPPLVGLGILALSGQDWEPVLARYGRENEGFTQRQLMQLMIIIII
jgi:hypothetical protein